MFLQNGVLSNFDLEVAGVFGNHGWGANGGGSESAAACLGEEFRRVVWVRVLVPSRACLLP
jgi:hypothetical protein